MAIEEGRGQKVREGKWVYFSVFEEKESRLGKKGVGLGEFGNFGISPRLLEVPSTAKLEPKVVNGFVCPFTSVIPSNEKYSSFLIIICFGDRVLPFRQACSV